MGYAPLGSNTPVGVATAAAPLGVTVTAVSTEIVPVNENRRYLLLSNTGLQDVFLSGNGVAENLKGYCLVKSIGSLILGSGVDITTSLHGIVGASSSIVTVQEFT